MKKAFGYYSLIFAGILTLAAMILYRNVMYTDTNVYICFGVALAAIVLSVALSGALKDNVLQSILIIVASAALGLGITFATAKMVNQIAYVVTSLDPFKTIQSFVTYAVLAVLDLIVVWVAAFAPTVKAEA